MERTTEHDQVAELHEAAAAALEGGRHDAAMVTFAEAVRLAGAVLPPADPVRLAVAAAHADAWFEHRADAERALSIAQAAYDDAVFAIDRADPAYRDVVRELGALRDQMTFWAFTMTRS